MDEETEREKAIKLNYKLLDKVDELWVFGEDTTEGMLDEISYATTKGIPIYEMGNVADIPEDVGEVDLVENPPHYTHGKYEVKDVIRDWKLYFHLGNVIKYVARCDHKGNKLQDLKKARFYLDDEIKFLEEKKGGRHCEEIDG